MEIVLEALWLAKTFVTEHRRQPALRGVNLRVRGGQITGLIGPDGAGKTTLMRLAAGLLHPDAGRIEVLGLDATHDSLAVQAAIGYMPQRFGLYEDLSVAENLELYADLQGVPLAVRRGRYAELMHMTGLAPFMERLAGRLSGGMKQKLGLACTLVKPPRLLLLDEPTVGVDPLSRRELWAIVHRLVAEAGMGVLLSTAYLDEAERCEEVILLHEGQVLGQGRPETVAAPTAGRAFLVDRAGESRRRLQGRLAAMPGVMDALVQGEGVRVVMGAGIADGAARLAAMDEGLAIRALPPRFEDGFIELIQSSRRNTEDSERHRGRGEERMATDGNRAHSSVSEAGHGPLGHPAAASPSLSIPPPRPLCPSVSSAFLPGPAPATEAIAVEGLERRFGDFYAVRDLTFQVAAGEVFGLLGANGAGKTTTFRMLCGLLPPSGGHLRVAGLDLRHAAAAARARIGYMSQRFSLYGNLSVAENLSFFANIYGLKRGERQGRIGWALEEFELEPHRDDDSAELPLGYKQRLALACALMHRPEILFLDEPTSGVDPLARREFWGRINRLSAEGVTVLVTTHFMEEAEYCDRLAIMATGRLLALGTPMEVKAAQHRAGASPPSMEEAFIALIECDEGNLPAEPARP